MDRFNTAQECWITHVTQLPNMDFLVPLMKPDQYFDGLVQIKRNSSVLAIMSFLH